MFSGVLLGTLSLFAGCGPGENRHPLTQSDTDVVAQMRSQINVGGGGGGAGAGAELTPTGFANIRGTVTLNGSAPALAPISVTGGDAAICSPGGQIPPNQAIVVGPNNGLANVLIYLDMTVPESWEHDDYLATKDALLAGEQGFDQKACVFLSHVFAMRSTQSVEIINSDPVGHNTNIAPSRGAQQSNNTLPSNSKSVYSPGGETAAPFKVTCAIHPWMSAWMITRDNPYFAVTKPDGSFEIKNVPAGVPLRFRIWQEAAPLKEVTINNEVTPLKKGRLNLTLQPQEEKEMSIVVDAGVFQ